MLRTSPRLLTLVGLLAATSMLARDAGAVDVLAISDLSSQEDVIRFPVHDDDFADWVKARVSSDVGQVGSVTPMAGTIEVTWTPPEDFAGGAVAFRVRYKDFAGAKQDRTFQVMVPAAASVPITVHAEPAVVAPDVEEVILKWTAPPSGQDPAQRGYALVASAGELGPVQVADDGTATASWRRPPGLDAPLMTLITVVDEGDPRRRGRLELPVQVSRSTTFQVPPDAKVQVTIGDDTMGPKQASPAGTVAFDLRLDPRVQQGRLSGRTPLGDDVNQVVDLPDRASPVVVLALPPLVQANTRKVPVAAATWVPTGEAAPTLTVGGGQLALDEPMDGWITGTLQLSPDLGDRVTVTAALEDAQAKGQVELTPGLFSVSASTEPSELTGSQRDVTVTAKAVDALQQPVMDTVGVLAIDGVLTARPTRRGDTTVARARKNRDSEALVLLTEPPGSVQGVPVAAVLPWLVELNDDAHLLRVAVVDSAGRAIAGVPIEVEVEGSRPQGLPMELKTDGYGLASASFSSTGAALGLSLSAGGHRGAVAMAPNGTVLLGGDPAWLQQQQVWSASAPTLVVTEKPAAVVAAAVPTAPSTEATEATDTSADASPPAVSRETRDKARSQSDDESAWLRASVAFQGASLTYSAITEDGGVGPLSATIADAGITGGGVAGHLLLWPGRGSWGLEADVRYEQAALSPLLTYATLELSEEDLAGVEGEDDLEAQIAGSQPSSFERSTIDMRVGFRYRAPLAGPLEGYGLLQFHRQEADLFLWSAGTVTDAVTPLMGARAGGGVLLEAGPVWVDVQAAETFAPYPIRFDVEGRIQANVRPKLAIHAGGGMSWRTMTFTVDDSELSVKDSQASFMLGLATSLR